MREMTDETGGFYSAEDADSVPPEHAGDLDAHRAEGAFYLWRAEEVDRLLGEESGIVKRRFGIDADGNAPLDPQQEFAGKNLLYVAKPVSDLAAESGRSVEEIDELLERARVQMFRARAKRPRPRLDDKILTAWNGLMIAAFARVARVLGGLGLEGREAGGAYLHAARRAAQFVYERLWRADSATLLRRFRDGQAEIDGYAEDYAYLIFGLLELFQADPSPKWLNWAITLQRRQDDLFWDAEGGWFSTTGRDPSVIVRMKDDYDGAEPAASSISVMNLLTLSHLVEERGWSDAIDRTLRLFGVRLGQIGRAVPMMAAALSAYLAGPQQIVIVGDESGALQRTVALRYLPFATLLVLSSEPERESAASAIPLLAAMRPVDSGGAAYVCRNFVCRPPATSVEALNNELRATH
jgi:uncharacterized protein YyaL (SSP411 family)